MVPHYDDRAVFRWNYWVLGTDLTLFVAATQIGSFTVVIPLYVTTLTTANWHVALVIALYNLGVSLPPIFVAFMVEQRTRLMPVLRWMALVQRIPFLCLGVLLLVVSPTHSAWLLVGLLLAVLLHGLGQGLVNLLWFDIVSRAVGSARFSRFMGQWGGLGTLFGLGGAALASGLLATKPYPANFALCFLFTFGLMMGSFLVQQGVREPMRPRYQREVPAKKMSVGEQVREVIAQDQRFQRVLVVLVISALPTFGSALYIPLARYQAHMSEAAITIELIVLELALILGSVLWGGDDERVLLWDLYNEVGNRSLSTLRLAAPAQFLANRAIAAYDRAEGAPALALLRAAFGWARAAAPRQPLTSSVYNTHRRVNRMVLALADVVTFHNYHDARHLAQQIVGLQALGRPVICTEYLARTEGSRFETHLPIFRRYHVGCYNWGLVAGKTQTAYSWRTRWADGREPDPWFHDILRSDGTPYQPAEVAAIRALTGPGDSARP